ncbi:Na-translocating system protein MpsC family protein [Paenibacillus cremeus]|uniref:DUF2294 family protein n=1 Tax=Paenibacillus cremeus TaxID=2163881 RepID=A0A559JDE6_9BACL|nr:Na-translocating system protein MpsC family protein [Paenibacillus cremeus]TVX97894.1 DUF2294 family protein [Paenibacillus cremeus]
MSFSNNDEFHLQNEIASHIGKLLRDTFGKGPQYIYASIHYPFIVIYLRNFITPTEKILLKQGQISSVRQIRDLVMKSLIPEIKAFLLLMTGIELVEFYYDWELYRHSGVFVGRQLEDLPLILESQERYEGKGKLHRELEIISQCVQKRPDQLSSYMLNKRTLLVVRSGILIEISRELIRLGDEDSLRKALNNLEKNDLRNNSQFQKILGTTIEDVFVDWNFQLDRSVIVFILRPAI